MQRWVDALGTSTPQYSSTDVGEPHAPVACAFVSRRSWSATVSGSRTMTSAHPGLLESSAACRGTMAEHPASDATSEAAAAAATTTREMRTLQANLAR